MVTLVVLWRAGRRVILIKLGGLDRRKGNQEGDTMVENSKSIRYQTEDREGEVSDELADEPLADVSGGTRQGDLDFNPDQFD